MIIVSYVIPSGFGDTFSIFYNPFIPSGLALRKVSYLN
jgi:hypothetical protein